VVQQQAQPISIRRVDEDPNPMAGIGDDARVGLMASPRMLRPRYFYDALGSELFEQITRLPEYYQTRTERAILERVASEIVGDLSPTALVEFGSGSATKTRVLLDAMRDHGLPSGYGAVEVSESALVASAHELLDRYPALRFEGLLEDFERHVLLPFEGETRLILFLGSTIGNLTRGEAIQFLHGVREGMGSADGFLIGFDLVKEPARLVAAYDDADGVTARFNLNVLTVLNRELDGDLDLDDFRHRAVYDHDRSRIEMHLVAVRPVRAHLARIDFDFRMEEGETIRTELSHKYTRDSAESLISGAGLRLARWDCDPQNLFALGLARRVG